MNEISGIMQASRLTSHPKVYMEKIGSLGIDSTLELKELKQLAGELEQIQQGVALMQEIRSSLELALRAISND